MDIEALANLDISKLTEDQASALEELGITEDIIQTAREVLESKEKQIECSLGEYMAQYVYKCKLCGDTSEQWFHMSKSKDYNHSLVSKRIKNGEFYEKLMGLPVKRYKRELFTCPQCEEKLLDKSKEELIKLLLESKRNYETSNR